MDRHEAEKKLHQAMRRAFHVREKAVAKARSAEDADAINRAKARYQEATDRAWEKYGTVAYGPKASHADSKRRTMVRRLPPRDKKGRFRKSARRGR